MEVETVAVSTGTASLTPHINAANASKTKAGGTFNSKAKTSDIMRRHYVLERSSVYHRLT